MMIDYEVLLIALIIAASCSLVGTFLVLRRQAMMADAISHTVLLGIVIAFMFVENLSSPLLIIGAVIMGVVTAVLIELLVKSRRTKEDSATGIVFPLLFSIAVIIISMEFSGTHLDIDAVLIGRIEATSIERLVVFGINFGAKKVYDSLLILLLNLVIFIVLYKELKIVSFDSAFSKVIGISPVIIHYLIMTQASLTAVTSFDSMGSILVIALMVGPAATSILLTKNLLKTVITSITIGIFNTIVGYFIALYFDVTIAGVISVVTLTTFLVVLFFEPRNGIIGSLIKRNNNKKDFDLLILLIHVNNHQEKEDYHQETHLQLIINELNWNHKRYIRTLRKAIINKYLVKEDIYLKLTNVGINYLTSKESQYHLI